MQDQNQQPDQIVYNFSAIEAKWQKFWEENKTFKTPNTSSKPKYYALDMFPFPSGDGLHVGHPEGYTATDIMSRFKRMKGFEALFLPGLDHAGISTQSVVEKKVWEEEQKTRRPF